MIYHVLQETYHLKNENIVNLSVKVLEGAQNL